MTKQKIIEHLTLGGYICHSDEQRTATVYDAAGQPVCACPVAVMDRIAKTDSMTKWCEKWGGVYVARYLGKRYSDHENSEHCRRIALDLDAYANWRVYKCPECGEVITVDSDIEKYRCPDCGFTDDLSEYEQQSIYDYFNDCLDIEYRCSSSREYRSAQVMVAWGGPNIYVDTASHNVELYWGGSEATWPLSYDAETAVDDWAEEYWRCL
jgi:predicted RNA-binding Zn-ribbon protein involved in translation (DUF1610 family)